jgi:hypothetical protein
MKTIEIKASSRRTDESDPKDPTTWRYHGFVTVDGIEVCHTLSYPRAPRRGFFSPAEAEQRATEQFADGIRSACR